MKKLILPAALLLASGCAQLNTGNTPQEFTLDKKYIVEWIGDQPLIDRSHLSITLGKDQRAFGHAGCNNWFASYQLSGQQLQLEAIATTRKLCAPSLMQQEQLFLEALAQIRRWDFSPQGQLQLWNAYGNVMRLWPAEPGKADQ